jgi:Arc/MetJ-type ribon-helix-helix transcriptional regulator
MKDKICVSLEEDIVSQMNDLLRDGTFRNRSHVIEFAVRKLIRGVENA